MPHFVDEITHEVVYRKHEFNLEAMNGQISFIPEEEDCFIMAHVPNQKHGWDIKVVEETKPAKGLEKVQTLGVKEKALRGQPYYNLIPANRLNQYHQDNKDFTLIYMADPEETSAKKEVITNEEVNEIRTRSGPSTSKTTTQKKRYSPTLHRDVSGEKPIKISS